MEVGTVWNVGIVDKITNIHVGCIEGKEAIDVDTVQEEPNMCQITLDPGAGASCRPKELMKDIPMKPKQKGVRLKVATVPYTHLTLLTDYSRQLPVISV